MYNRFHRAQKECLMLNSHNPRIDSLIGPKRYYYSFSGNIFNELHGWKEKNPHVIQYPNISDSIFYKVNGSLLKKNNHLIQISVREMHNDLILPVFQGRFYGAIN